MGRSTYAADGTIPNNLTTYAVGQVATILGCDKTTIRRMTDEGRLKGFRLRGKGSERRISRGALIRYLTDTRASHILKDFFGLDMEPEPTTGGPTEDERRRRQESLARISRRARGAQDPL